MLRPLILGKITYSTGVIYPIAAPVKHGEGHVLGAVFGDAAQEPMKLSRCYPAHEKARPLPRKGHHVAGL